MGIIQIFKQMFGKKTNIQPLIEQEASKNIREVIEVIAKDLVNNFDKWEYNSNDDRYIRKIDNEVIRLWRTSYATVITSPHTKLNSDENQLLLKAFSLGQEKKYQAELKLSENELNNLVLKLKIENQ